MPPFRKKTAGEPRFLSAALAGAVVSIALLASLASAAAHDEIETEHLFGFTEGSDTGPRGLIEAEFDTIGRFSKAGGSYAAIEKTLELKYSLTDAFRIAPAVTGSFLSSSAVPDIDDFRGWNAQGASFEMKYRLIPREQGPFGLTLSATPVWDRVDGETGRRALHIGGEFLAAFDKELVANRIFAAFNVIYELGSTRPKDTGLWERHSQFGLAAAITNQILPGVFLGGEVRYFRAYEGLGLQQFAGEAWFAGPAMFVRLSHRLNMTIGWNAQLSGKPASGPRGLDLINFERHQARLRFGVEL